MNAQAIKTTNQGRTLPPGTKLPAGVDNLDDYIVLHTDGGRWRVKDRAEPQEALWKVIYGTDIAKLPAEILANMKFEGGNTFAVDPQGDLMLYVREGAPDFDDMLNILGEAGIGLVGDNASFERTVDADENIRDRVPALLSAGVKRITRESGMALLARIKSTPQGPTTESPEL